MKRILLSCFSLLVIFSIQAQVTFTANDVVIPYEGLFRPGTNLGFQDDSALYSDEDLANIAAGNPAEGIVGVGAKAIRPSLPANFIDTWGLELRLPTFAFYKDLGLEELTCFVGFPSEAERDPRSLLVVEPSQPCSKTCMNLFGMVVQMVHHTMKITTMLLTYIKW